MEKLNGLVQRAVSDGHDSIPPELNKQILQIVQSRVDMPKHVINAISKRMIMKNKKLLINAFNLIEFLAYECELSLYSQIATKQFLFKISGLLMNKDVDPDVKTKILQTIYCLQELFRPHDDLVPLFFQFYAGVLKQQFEIPHGYVSPFRPAKLREYKKRQEEIKREEKKKSVPPPSKSQMKVFEEIREKLILTNVPAKQTQEIIDNAAPSDNVKDNEVLIELMEAMKDCQKKVNKTINENPNEKVMEMALAINDDIFITYRRYKDLQRNRKPEPFILTELVSDVLKEQESRRSVIIPSNEIKSRPKVEEIRQPRIQNMQPIKPVEKKPEFNILDLDYEPEKKEPVTNTNTHTNPNQNLFDLLGQPTTTNNTMPNPNQFQTNEDLLGTNSGQSTIPQPSGNGISLNINEFKTESDMKPYDDRNIIEKLTDLSDMRDFGKK